MYVFVLMYVQCLGANMKMAERPDDKMKMIDRDEEKMVMRETQYDNIKMIKR